MSEVATILLRPDGEEYRIDGALLDLPTGHLIDLEPSAEIYIRDTERTVMVTGRRPTVLRLSPECTTTLAVYDVVFRPDARPPQ